MKQEKVGAEDPISMLSYKIVELGSRVKILESRYSILKRRAELLESNIVELNKEMDKELGNFHSNYIELKRAISDLNKKMRVVLEELEDTASKAELEYIKTYLELINPLQFATKNDLKEALSKIKEEKD